MVIDTLSQEKKKMGAEVEEGWSGSWEAARKRPQPTARRPAGAQAQGRWRRRSEPDLRSQQAMPASTAEVASTNSSSAIAEDPTESKVVYMRVLIGF